MKKNKNMKKKFILSLGTIAAITTPVMAVVSCGGKKVEDEKNGSEVEKQLNQILDLVSGINQSDKSSIVKLAKEFLLNGTESISEDSLIKLLNNLGVSNDIQDMVKNIFIKDGKIDNTILKMLFNDGLAKLAEGENSEILDKVISGIYNILPTNIQEKISKDFIKKVLTGLTQQEWISFAKNSLSNSAIGLAYPLIPILKKGLLQSSQSDWKTTITNLATTWKSSIGTYIKKALPHDVKLQDRWQLGNLIGNILNSLETLGNSTDLDDLTNAINSFFNNGLNSLTSNQKRDITNLIDWGHDYHQYEIFESDKKTLRNGLKNLFANLKDKEGNTLELTSIDNAKNYDDIIDAAKNIKAYNGSIEAAVDIKQYLEDNVKNFHFHINSMRTINKYKSDIKTELSKLKTKLATTDAKAITPLVLTSLDDKETVQALSDEALNILKAATNGVFKADGTTQVTTDPDLKALYPTMPARQYGYELTKEILTKDTKGDILGAKIAYQILINIKPISKLILKGMPKTEADWNILKSALINTIKPILDKSKLKSISNILPSTLDTLFKVVQEARK